MASNILYGKHYHTVRENETLIGLALKYGVTTADIRATNKMSTTSVLEPGQTITILLAKEMLPGSGDGCLAADSGPSVIASDAEDIDDGYEAAVENFKIRYFLKLKQGPLFRYIGKGYVQRWMYLVDHHLLDFETEYSKTPCRVYELKYPHSVIVRSGTDIQITFTKSKRNHRTVRLYLRALSEEDAVDWTDIIDSVSRKFIGTSKKDDRHLSFEEYVSNITLLSSPFADEVATAFPEGSKQFPLFNFSINGFLRGGVCSSPPVLDKHPNTGDAEIFHKSSQLSCDALMDDVLDAITDMCEIDACSTSLIDVLLNSYTSTNSSDPRLQDTRLISLRDFWVHMPHWFDGDSCELGRCVLSSSADRTLSTCIFGALILCLSSPQTSILLKYGSIESSSFCFDPSIFRPTRIYQLNDKLMSLIECTMNLLLDVILILCSHIDPSPREYEGGASSRKYGGHLARGSPAWVKLVRIRAYFSIIRRRAMSLFGRHDSWPFEHFGLPLNQSYCTFLLSTFTTSLLETFSGNCAAEKAGICMLCRYVGHLLGFQLSNVDSLWSNPDNMRQLSASAFTFFAEKNEISFYSIACVREIQTSRMHFYDNRNGAIQRLFSLYEFEYFVTSTCGIDVANSYVCEYNILGRFGVWIFAVFFWFIYAFIRRRPYASSTESGIPHNDLLVDNINTIIPGLCEKADGTRVAGIKKSMFMTSKAAEFTIDNAE